MSETVFKFGVSTWAVFLIGVCLMWSVFAVRADEAAYQVQPGDVLQVSVWKEADLQAEVLVRSDGGISFPLTGELQVAGLTTAQISVAIGDRIKKYIPDPVVTVAIKAIGGNRIYVLGKVNRPGEYPFSRPIDVMQALSLASGTSPYASLSNIYILRREGSQQKVFRFDYTDVVKGRQLDSNILLQSGDTVVVP